MSRRFDDILDDFGNMTDGQMADYMNEMAMDEPDCDCDDMGDDCDE